MANAITPYRRSILKLDPNGVVASAPPFALHRTGAEIARGGTEPYGTQGVTQMGSGAWALTCVQVERGYHTERTDNHSSNLGVSDFILAAGVVMRVRNRKPSDLNGLTIDTHYADSSNFMLIAAPAAGATNFSQELTADAAAYPSPSLPTQNIKMDRKAKSAATYPPDQNYAFTFEIPGNAVNNPDFIVSFNFGGPALPDGSGQYHLAFRGSGDMVLMEKTNVAPGWNILQSWWYAAPNHVAGAHTVLIQPHRNSTGGAYIDFIVYSSAGKSQSSSLVTGYVPGSAVTGYHTYRLKNFKQVAQSGVNAGIRRKNITGAGPFRVDHRQDARVWFQPSLLKYLSPGTLVDWPFCVPFLSSGSPDLVLSWDAVVPPGCSVVGKLYNATTAAELTATGSGTNYRTYTPHPGQPYYYAVFTLTSNADNSETPRLWGYTVAQNSEYASVTGLQTQVPANGGILRSTSFTGGEKDPTHETGQFVVEDPANVVTKLNRRAEIPFRYEVTYDPTDQTKTVCIGSGYITRATATHKGGKARRGLSGTTARAFPAYGWRSFECTSVGEWLRLQASPLLIRVNVAQSPDLDPFDPSISLPFRVTDIVRQMLGYAGYAPNQIDVPNSEIRFFVGASGSASSFLIEPGVSIGDWVIKTLKDYLGWHLLWDANAGSGGMWRVRKPALPDEDGNYAVLANIYTGAAAGKLVTSSATYNGRANSASPGPYVGDGANPVGAFIIKRNGISTLRGWVKAAEANAVYVTGTGELLSGGGGQFRLSQWAFNPKAFNLPGAGAADATHPDYGGGFFKPILLFDPSQSEQPAVDFLTRRLYDQACHAIKCISFEIPAVFVVDPNDPLQTAPRPLRYYDPIAVHDGNGNTTQWLVRNCSTHFDKTGFMLCTVECEAPRESIS